MEKRNIWICISLFIGMLLIVTSSCKKDNNNPSTIKDIDGNIYHAVTIGTQVWMVENLKTTRYNDGTIIPLITNNAIWAALTSPGCCSYNNTTNTDTINIYGRLYNWYTVSTNKLCPIGWHVPTNIEWTTLITYLGGESVAGSKLKELGITRWNGPNIGASNSSGFTALPGGRRYPDGTFHDLGLKNCLWSSTIWNNGAYSYMISYDDSSLLTGNSSMNVGISVRCLKD